MSEPSHPPDAGAWLSAVTVGVHGLGQLRPVLGALARQTIASHLEVVIVVLRNAVDESACAAIRDAEAVFAAVRIVEIDPPQTTGDALAAGMLAATGRVVAYTEEHSWPQPDWAEQIVAAHGAGIAAVGWTPEPANPGTVSWLAGVTDFGPALGRRAGEPVGALAWHHTSYPRERVLPRAGRLGMLLESEWLLHDELAVEGEMRFCATARSRHWNPSRYRAHLGAELRGGIGFGASRVERDGWGPARRLIVGLAAPLAFAVRLRSRLKDARRAGAPRRVRALLPLSVAAAVTGEARGVVFGPGDARQRRAHFELDRRRALSRADQRRWPAPGRPDPAGAERPVVAAAFPV